MIASLKQGLKNHRSINQASIYKNEVFSWEFWLLTPFFENVFLILNGFCYLSFEKQFNPF